MATAETGQPAEISQGTWTRAGFWRRFLALTADGIAVSVAVVVVGLVLYSLTGGAVRVSNGLYMSTRCTSIKPTPAQLKELRLRDDFKVTGVFACARSVFGFEHDRILTVVEETKSGTINFRRTVTFPLDGNWRVTSAFYLDNLTIFLLAAYLIVLQWLTGRTPGKRIFGLYARSLDGERIGLSQATVRTLVLFACFIPSIVATLVTIIAGPVAALEFLTSYYFIILVLGVGVFVIWLAEFAWSTRKGALPWHDRAAGTEIVRWRAADGLTGLTAGP